MRGSDEACLIPTIRRVGPIFLRLHRGGVRLLFTVWEGSAIPEVVTSRRDVGRASVRQMAWKSSLRREKVDVSAKSVF